MNNVNNAINKQQIGKTMPKYLFVISCSFISFQKLLSSNLLYNQVLHTACPHLKLIHMTQNWCKYLSLILWYNSIRLGLTT